MCRVLTERKGTTTTFSCLETCGRRAKVTARLSVRGLQLGGAHCRSSDIVANGSFILREVVAEHFYETGRLIVVGGQAYSSKVESGLQYLA